MLLARVKSIAERSALPAAGIVSAFTLVVMSAAPAHAHGADAPSATNFRTVITRAPDLPGLSVRVIEAGARLQLTNHSGQNVEVLGYQGEPYLEVRPDGVYENVHSPATYLNVTIAHVDPPAHADPTVPPEWRKVSDEPMHRWHDQRVLWTQPFTPANPDAVQHIRDWTVPLRTGATPLELAGTLSWVPPPPAFAWWAVTVALTGLLALLGFARLRAGAVMAGIVITAGVLALGYGVARERDAGNDSFGSIFVQLFASQLWSTVTALAAIAAGIYAFMRREDNFALAQGGAVVGLFAGMVNAAVFHRSVTPVPWDPDLARVVIALVIALGVGVALAAMVRLRRAAATASPDRVNNRTPGDLD